MSTESTSGNVTPKILTAEPSAYKLTEFGIPMLNDDMNGVMSIKVNKAEIDRFAMQASSKPAMVLSFLGDTHAGKSFLVNCFQELLMDKFAVHLATVAGSKKTQPTSANVQLFRLLSDKDTIMLIQDIEGTEASNILPMDISESEMQLASVFNGDMQNYCSVRRESVKHHLPKFAYVTSNIVVYVTKLDVSNHDMYKKLKDLALTLVTNGVYNAEKPVLFVVCNQQHPEDIEDHLDVETTSTEFIQAHGTELLDLYHSVKVINIPRRSKYCQEMFDAQLEKLIHLCNQLGEESLNRKKKLGSCFTERILCDLYPLVIEELNKNVPIRMGQLFIDAMSVQHDLFVKRAINFFKQLRSEHIHFEAQEFRELRRTGMQFLLCSILEQHASAIEKMKNDTTLNNNEDNLISGNALTVLFNTTAQPACEAYLELINKLQPCAAVTEAIIDDPETRTKKKATVSCTDNMCTHDSDMHYNKTVIKHDKSFRITKFFKKLWNGKKSKPVKWKGNFDYDETENLPEIYKQMYWKLIQCTDTTADAAILNQHLIRASMIECVKQVPFTDIASDLCMLCFRTSYQWSQTMCGHRMCTTHCAPKMTALCEQYQGTLYSLVSENPVELDRCPICKGALVLKK